jgi:1-acyl-sn-glycerol-3-phosphate acyltransferase
MFGVRVHVEGLENLKKIHGAVLVFNHASFFDIFALAATIRGLRFGAKVELFKIPFFGAAMRQVGMLPIDRARRERVFRIYDEATARMHNGEKFALAPEGGRAGQSLAGAGAGAQVLAPFKSGPFVFAIQAKVPIVPVVIRGTSQVLPKGQLFPNWDRWSRNVEVRILAPLETQDYELKDRPELQEQVHLLMRSQLI